MTHAQSARLAVKDLVSRRCLAIRLRGWTQRMLLSLSRHPQTCNTTRHRQSPDGPQATFVAHQVKVEDLLYYLLLLIDVQSSCHTVLCADWTSAADTDCVSPSSVVKDFLYCRHSPVIHILLYQFPPTSSFLQSTPGVSSLSWKLGVPNEIFAFNKMSNNGVSMLSPTV